VLEKVGSRKEDRVRRHWVATLLAEYRAVYYVLNGGEGVIAEADIEIFTDEREAGRLSIEFHRGLLDMIRREYDEFEELMPEEGYVRDEVEKSLRRIARLVRRGFAKRDYDYVLEAARRLNELFGSYDSLVVVYACRLKPPKPVLTIDEARSVAELGDRIADMLSGLGGRAEAELRKLIFSGYKPEVVDTVEGLSDEDRKLLRKILKTPYLRASLLFAYKRVGNWRELERELLRTVLKRGSPIFLANALYIPLLYDYI